jgi:pyruvate/2-oxoglutarate dehydrogenase complex dihydrolipoamide dehydrogenase (E3) component
VKKGLFPWTASGRAIAKGRDEGMTKLLLRQKWRTVAARTCRLARSNPTMAAKFEELSGNTPD